MSGVAVAVNIGAGRVWVGAAIQAPQLEQHEFGVSLQLHAEPVPSSVNGLEQVREPFVVRPSCTGDGGTVYRPDSVQQRKGNIIRSLACPLADLADAVFAMNNRWCAGREPEGEADSLGHGRKGYDARRLIPAGRPIAVPNAAFFQADAGDAGTGPVQAFLVAEALAIDVGERHMGEIEIVHTPNRRIVILLLALAPPEERQLEAVPASLCTAQVAGVIPPFGAEVRVIEVIAGELVAITGEDLVIDGAGRNRGERDHPERRVASGVSAHGITRRYRGVRIPEVPRAGILLFR